MSEKEMTEEKKRIKLYTAGWVTKTVYTKVVDDYEKVQTVIDKEETTWKKIIGMDHLEDGRVSDGVVHFEIFNGPRDMVYGRLWTSDRALTDDYDWNTGPRFPEIDLRDVAANWKEMAEVLNATFQRIVAARGLDLEIETVMPVVE